MCCICVKSQIYLHIVSLDEKLGSAMPLRRPEFEYRLDLLLVTYCYWPGRIRTSGSFLIRWYPSSSDR